MNRGEMQFWGFISFLLTLGVTLCRANGLRGEGRLGGLYHSNSLSAWWRYVFMCLCVYVCMRRGFVRG